MNSVNVVEVESAIKIQFNFSKMSVAVDQLQGKEVELVKGKEFWVSSKFYMARATLHYLLFERFLHKLFSSKVKYLYSIVLLKSFLANVVNLLWNRVSHITPFFKLSYTLLTTHAIGLYEVTKKISVL